MGRRNSIEIRERKSTLGTTNEIMNRKQIRNRCVCLTTVIAESRGAGKEGEYNVHREQTITFFLSWNVCFA